MLRKIFVPRSEMTDTHDVMFGFADYLGGIPDTRTAGGNLYFGETVGVGAMRPKHPQVPAADVVGVTVTGETEDRGNPGVLLVGVLAAGQARTATRSIVTVYTRDGAQAVFRLKTLPAKVTAQLSPWCASRSIPLNQPPAAAAQPAPAPVPDLTARLVELAQLHTAGALTDAEYSAAKSQVLGGL